MSLERIKKGCIELLAISGLLCFTAVCLSLILQIMIGAYTNYQCHIVQVYSMCK